MCFLGDEKNFNNGGKCSTGVIQGVTDIAYRIAP